MVLWTINLIESARSHFALHRFDGMDGVNGRTSPLAELLSHFVYVRLAPQRRNFAGLVKKKLLLALKWENMVNSRSIFALVAFPILASAIKKTGNTCLLVMDPTMKICNIYAKTIPTNCINMIMANECVKLVFICIINTDMNVVSSKKGRCHQMITYWFVTLWLIITSGS